MREREKERERERERTNQKVRMFLVMKPAKFDAEHVSPSIYIFVNNCIYLTCTLDIKVYNNSYHNYEIHDVCWHLQTPRLIDYKLHFSLILCMSRMLMYKHCKWRGYCMRKISSQLFHWMVFLLLFNKNFWRKQQTLNACFVSAAIFFTDR